MGGRIARNFALRHPDRLRSLVLAGTRPASTRSRGRGEALRRRAAHRDAGKPAAAGQPARGWRLRGAARQRAARPPGLVREDARGLGRAGPRGADRKIKRADARDHRRRGQGLSARDGADMARRIPGAELVTMQGVGHLRNLEQPDEFNQAVLDFLSDRRSSHDAKRVALVTGAGTGIGKSAALALLKDGYYVGAGRTAQGHAGEDRGRVGRRGSRLVLRRTSPRTPR